MTICRRQEEVRWSRLGASEVLSDMVPRQVAATAVLNGTRSRQRKFAAADARPRRGMTAPANASMFAWAPSPPHTGRGSLFSKCCFQAYAKVDIRPARFCDSVPSKIIVRSIKHCRVQLAVGADEMATVVPAIAGLTIGMGTVELVGGDGHEPLLRGDRSIKCAGLDGSTGRSSGATSADIAVELVGGGCRRARPASCTAREDGR